MRIRLPAFLLVSTLCVWSAAADLVIGEALRLPTRGYSCSPAIAYGDGSYLVVWQEGWHGLGGQSDILAARIGSGGKLLDSKPIIVCGNDGVQARPAVAYSRESKLFLVVWGDLRNNRDYNVYATRVSSAGKVLDSEPLRIRSTVDVNEVEPTVASDGKNFLVAWSQFTMAESAKGESYPTYGVLATRVAPSGMLLNKQPVVLPDNGHSPAVACDGKSFLIVYTSSDGRDMKGIRLSLEGEILDPEPIVGITSQRAACPEYPAVTATRNGYVALGSRTPIPSWWGWSGPGAFMAGRVKPDGQAPESEIKITGWMWGKISDEEVPNVVDAARWGDDNGAKVLKGWPKGRPGGFRSSYRNEWPYSYGALTNDGRGGCVVAWTVGHLVGTVNVHQFDIHVRHLEPDNNWAKGPKIEAAATEADEIFPAIATGLKNELLLGYELMEPEKAPVIAVRTVTVR